LRTGLALAQAGEFGFVILAHPAALALVPPDWMQPILAAMLLSMLVSPLIIHHSDKLVLRLARSEWMLRSLDLHRIAVKSLATERHVVICGYGRTGQSLARFLHQHGIGYFALDLDPERVREAAAAGDDVAYGDAARRETLIAAGLGRASALVISYTDTPSALKILRHAREINPALPVIVRTRDDADLDKLSAAGAAEVVPETFEASLMLASPALLLLGVPVKKVLISIRTVRDERYRLLRGFFHGESDEADDPDEALQPRLHSVTLAPASYAVGRTIGELDMENLDVTVSAVRQSQVRLGSPLPDTRLEAGDVVVLLGIPERLAAAEIRLLQG
jgi:monovalent cation:H+ antiporter-2, CPA2 family